LELPLDHFRLIGVSPSATSEEILRAFQLRLDKTPDEGFTYEVLTQRSELLRLTADLLTDPESRREYENLLLNGNSGLDFSSNREVAGLLLLWESGSPKEAFKITRKALQPPQTPALGSSREADLTLLAALTARDSAIQEQQLRSYSNAADFLHEGIQLLQRMGKLGEKRKELEEDLVALLPYRILDLLSRDLNDQESHKKGLSMLENLINKRGGLEGSNKSEYRDYLDQQEFEAFFQQIKPYLTVQEQIDLFIELQKRGSLEAGFLAFLSLTAIGFSRRKPEKLFEARRILKKLNFPVFVKPSNSGSSLGISKVKNESEKLLAIEKARGIDPRILIEEGLEVREIECGIIGNSKLLTSEIGEVNYESDWYDYDSKYHSNNKIIIPAEIDSKITKEIKEIAIKSCRALNIFGFARVDFFLEKSSIKILLNEINTIPGFTKNSMFPMLWKASGLNIEQLVAKLVDISLDL